MKPKHLIEGERLAKAMTGNDAYKLAQDMIRHYVEIGETISQLRAGQMGCTLGEFVGFGSIGGFSYIQKKNVGTDNIIIRLEDEREFIYKLSDVYNSVLNRQQTLF